MKYLHLLLVTITICSEFSSALKFINPIVLEVQERFKLSWDQLKVKCDKRDTSLFPKIENLRDKYDLKSAKVKDEILEQAKKCCPVTDEKWKELINQKCFPNKSLISISKGAINTIQLCLDKTDQLNQKQEEYAKRELLNRFCSMIKIWSKSEYTNQGICKTA